MRSIISKPPSVFLCLSLLFGFALFIGATKIADFDIWWHLKTGEIIRAWGTIPKYDIFSYTAPGASWVNHEWLFQVFASFLYDHFGIASLTLAKLAIILCAAFFLYKTFKLFVSSDGLALFGSVVILWSMADRVMIRPFLFSSLFIIIFCYFLHRFVCLGKGRIWILPIIQLLWINLHGGALLGPMIVFSFAFGESFQKVLKKDLNFGGPEEITNRKIIYLWIVCFLTLLACLANPEGINIFLFSVRHLKMDAIMSFTQEWLPALDSRLNYVVSLIIFKIVIVLIFISYFLNLKKVRLSHICLTALSGALILKGSRFSPDFVIINLPLAFLNFKSLKPRFAYLIQRKIITEWVLLSVVFVFLASVFYNGLPLLLNSQGVNNVGFGALSSFAPKNMVDFLEENNISGKVFNEVGVGGYLIFSRWPADLVFIDGRTPVYGDDFYQKYIAVFSHSRNFENLDKIYHFDYLVFKADQAWNLRYMHEYLWKNPMWKLVFFDGSEGLVYLRNIPRFNKILDKYEMKRHPIVDAMKIRRL
ncbi:MAG: hypothetical protein COS89_00650 [Deltaproteobacteria bacterium CG07_land_8_20_14_0_80_38_7]|nr:MAG: hypothetical protein COS89_00650 [Deltaproteobacteria bacterium CG07_land_8_20_14_0_80_38_7]